MEYKVAPITIGRDTRNVENFISDPDEMPRTRRKRKDSSGDILPVDSPDAGRIPIEMRRGDQAESSDEIEEDLSAEEDLEEAAEEDLEEAAEEDEPVDELRESWNHAPEFYDCLKAEFTKFSNGGESLGQEELCEFMIAGYPKLKSSRRKDQKIADFMSRYGTDGAMRWEDLVIVYKKDNEKKLRKEFISRGYKKEMEVEEEVKEEPAEPEVQVISHDDINRLLRVEFKKFSSNRKHLSRRELSMFFLAGYPDLKKNSPKHKNMVDVFLKRFGEKSAYGSGEVRTRIQLENAYKQCKIPELITEFRHRGYDSQLDRLIKRKTKSQSEPATSRAEKPSTKKLSEGTTSQAKRPSTRKLSEGTTSRAERPSTRKVSEGSERGYRKSSGASSSRDRSARRAPASRRLENFEKSQ